LLRAARQGSRWALGRDCRQVRQASRHVRVVATRAGHTAREGRWLRALFRHDGAGGNSRTGAAHSRVSPGEASLATNDLRPRSPKMMENCEPPAASIDPERVRNSAAEWARFDAPPQRE